ncbi:MAG: 5-methyltetrahydropteroyltriglutamate--homocysteine methyltransferase, partial [Rhodospirillaceae bacterium]|nr:5-methyltetrahydropteroyltriglutamate--homocysteine methyltransferase [Rhodospirillaceae bacterium]
MQRTKPPFRADQVGSLLRSAPVKEARTRRGTAEITPAGLKAVEDAEISKLVARQEAIGLQAVTDGEFRRSWWHFDFLKYLNGCELYATEGIQFAGVTTRGESIRVKGKLDFPADHP